MAQTRPSDRLAPRFQLRIDGTPLPAAAELDLIDLSVLLDVAAPSMFAVRLNNWDEVRRRITWSDGDLFNLGKEVEVRMGYADDLAPVMMGEITGLEPEFRADDLPQLVVRGHDRRHRLMRGRKTLSFTEVKDSDLAVQLAGDAGLSAQAEDTKVVHEYVLQHDQTDLELLAGRAHRIGFEVVVEGKILHFRPRKNDAGAALTLARDEDLVEFCPRLTTLGQAGEVEVRGWSPKDKKELLGKAASGDLGTKMGGSVSGPAAAERAFGAVGGGVAAVAAIPDTALTQAEADQVAAGRLGEMALSYVTGQGVALGRADLKAGIVVQIDGVGERFGGLYYVTSSCHTYSPRRGYRTAFTCRRNAT